MLSRMDGAADAENLLRSGYRGVVNPAGAEYVEASPESGARQKRKPRATCPTVQIQAEGRTKTTNLSGRWRKNRVYIGITFQNLAKAVLHDHTEAQIRAVRLQQMQSRSAKNTIAERTQTDHHDSVARTKSFENVGSCGQEPLLVNGGFVDQHHRNIIAHGIKAVAGDAAQAAAIRLQFDFCPAGGTDEDLEQFSADGHVEKL